VMESMHDLVWRHEQFDISEEVMFPLRQLLEILGESFRDRGGHCRQGNFDGMIDRPAIVASFNRLDRDAVVSWSPGSRAAGNKTGVK
jgi:hypothetical protein